MVNCYIFDRYDAGEPVISRDIENTPEVLYANSANDKITGDQLLQAANEKAKDMAKKLIVKGQMSVEEIADLTELPIDEVVELAGLQIV